MKIIDFLRVLALEFASLNVNVTMCYHMHDDEWLIGNIMGKNSLRIYKDKHTQKPVDHRNAFKELIINFTEKEITKVKCIYVDGMYFMPGNCDEAIIFGKDLNILLNDSWQTKNCNNYELIRL